MRVATGGRNCTMASGSPPPWCSPTARVSLRKEARSADEVGKPRACAYAHAGVVLPCQLRIPVKKVRKTLVLVEFLRYTKICKLCIPLYT